MNDDRDKDSEERSVLLIFPLRVKLGILDIYYYCISDYFCSSERTLLETLVVSDNKTYCLSHTGKVNKYSTLKHVNAPYYHCEYELSTLVTLFLLLISIPQRPPLIQAQNLVCYCRLGAKLVTNNDKIAQYKYCTGQYTCIHCWSLSLLHTFTLVVRIGNYFF